MTRFLLPAALAVALAGSSAYAQVNAGAAVAGANRISIQTGTNAGLQGPFTLAGTRFNFIPGTGFVPVGGTGAILAPVARGAVLPTIPANAPRVFLNVDGQPSQFVQNVGVLPVSGQGTAFLPRQLAQVPGEGIGAPGDVLRPGPGGQIVDPALIGAPQGAQQGLLQFVPGAGFVPQTAFPLATAPQFDPRFLNSFGVSPFFGGGVGPWWGGTIPLTPVYNRPINQIGVVTAPTTATVGVPTLGISSFPTAIPRQRARVVFDTTEPNMGVSRPAQRVAGQRQEIGGQAQDPQEARLVSRVRSMMLNDRPLYGGTVAQIGATGAQVRYQPNGTTRTERFGLGEVFFFNDGGELTSAATGAPMLSVGDSVLVPGPRERAGAGSGEETRIGGFTVTEPGTRR